MDDSCVSFAFLDRVIVVESESLRFIEDLRNCFEDVVSHPSGGGGSVDLYASVAVIPKTATDAELQLEVTSRPERVLRMGTVRMPSAGWTVARALVQWAVDSARNYYVFHSGSVARDGRGILLPGSTHSGKSTLTVALAQRGFAILSDEVGAIRADDGVQTGFGRALSVRSAVVAELGIEDRLGWKILEEGAYIFRASALGLSRTSEARPSLIVAPTYRECAAVDLRPLRPAAAVMGLYEASCSQPRWKVAGLDFLIELATSVPCFELTYSNMYDAARAIEKTFTEVCASETIATLSRGRSADQGESSQ